MQCVRRVALTLRECQFTNVFSSIRTIHVCPEARYCGLVLCEGELLAFRSRLGLCYRVTAKHGSPGLRVTGNPIARFLPNASAPHMHRKLAPEAVPEKVGKRRFRPPG